MKDANFYNKIWKLTIPIYVYIYIINDSNGIFITLTKKAPYHMIYCKQVR